MTTIKQSTLLVLPLVGMIMLLTTGCSQTATSPEAALAAPPQVETVSEAPDARPLTLAAGDKLGTLIVGHHPVVLAKRIESIQMAARNQEESF